ncbi:hypothetical protein CMT41_00570 [Colwellia sp. MT41]|uniref:Lcl C-terminal domain-containing protein n=1 Tax=Colwellia sp. MT41 TaxID=58049 RepID=UPI0007179137|nr:DUF1566 domain-containing protein [Colwellia sp. MT41]ALO33369.1 hypothetical protein CMT41_00570 [Colwellia sp. MT41]
MNNPIKTALLSVLMLIALPSNGQTCNSSITPSTPTSQFDLNSDGTVTDNKTELIWMRCSLGQTWNASDSSCSGSALNYNWQSALTTANSTSFAGQNNWRLPNIKELKSIAEQACYSPAINVSVFPDTSTSNYWSSSPGASSNNYAWIVYFSNGYGYYDSKSDYGHVRLVRGGQ